MYDDEISSFRRICRSECEMTLSQVRPLSLRAEDCRSRAREMLDAAERAESDELKSELLMLATEWLKLAAEMHESARVG